MTRDYRDRLDPSGEVRSMARVFGSPLARLLMRMAGMSEQAAIAKETAEGTKALMRTLDEAADTLTELGWIVFNLSPVEEYGRAAELVRAGKPQDAAQLLVEAWNEGNRLAFVNRVFAVYSGHPEQHEVGLERGRLLREAVDLHRAGNYAGAILIALSQIDGIVFDMTGQEARGFFARVGKGDHLTDETTLAGHPRGLLFLNRLFNKGAWTTRRTTDLGRHGIMHGRSLAYNTRENSTKALVAVMSVIEWATSIGQARTAKASEERQAKYAGSQEVDEDGRRLDRRGFKEGKFLLEEIHLYEHGRYAHQGQYTSNLGDLLLSETARKPLELEGASVELVATSGTFHAWYVTPTGFVFGIAGAGGDFNQSWKYAGERPPKGGPDDDEGWRHAARDVGHVEW